MTKSVDLLNTANLPIFDSLPVGILIVDEVGIIVHANKACHDLSGYAAGELLEQDIENLVYYSSKFTDFTSLSELFTDLFGSPALAAIRSKEGDLVPITVTYQVENSLAIVCLNAAGDVRNYIQSMERQLEEFKNHVSDMHFTHEALESQGAELARLSEEYGYAKQQADEANKAKSEFLATMSHELRTPLNGIMGMASVLLNSRIDNELAQNIKTIFDSGEILLELLNDILDLSKIEAGHLDLEIIGLDLDHLIKQLQLLWLPKISAKGLTLKLDIDENIPSYIQSDPVRLRQLLTNLVNNAVKFTHTGTITLSVRKSQSGYNAGRLEFAVSDTGIGIAEEALDTLFEKFTQADSSTTRQYGGTGLGLAICKQLTELLGGTISVTSELGFGSTFTFVVPFQEADEEAVLEWQHNNDFEQAVVDHIPADILVVEDNSVNQTVLLKTLEGSVKSITLAENGQEAVQMVKENGYDIILMDIQMPVMDGVEATRTIRSLSDPLKAATPIIALTANAMTGDREKYLKQGMNDYVTKPIEKYTLLSVIDRQARMKGIVSEYGSKQDIPDMTTASGMDNQSQTLKTQQDQALDSLLSDL